MALPGFIPVQAPNATTQHWISAPTSYGAAQAPAGEITPAGCEWYDYIYAPVACGFVALNEQYGYHGYGFSPCRCWQIPLDPAGCAALPASKNRLGSISYCE
jgi:hypothetical protein